jgi:two-component system chemotaxis response regulator CheY
MDQPRILVVDDDLFVRVLLRDALEETALPVSEAADGEQAVTMAQAEQPALVFLDLFMPRKSGLEALGEILKVSPASKVVVLTGMDTQGMEKLAIDAGAFDFIAKPFHPLEVVAAVTRALDS